MREEGGADAGDARAASFSADISANGSADRYRPKLASCDIEAFRIRTRPSTPAHAVSTCSSMSTGEENRPFAV
jgi:hypothetical protein